MRVISGKYRGKKLKEFELNTTRPTLDRVKESMFNLVQFDILGSVVLDLFSGTGALGIECISRGAEFVCLVDKNIEAIKIIKENTKNMTENFDIVQSDYMDFLKNTNKKFDLVLLDPPFNEDYGLRAIDYIISNDKLNENGIILFETSADNQQDLCFDGYKTTRKKYGTVAIYKLVRIQ